MTPTLHNTNWAALTTAEKARLSALLATKCELETKGALDSLTESELSELKLTRKLLKRNSANLPTLYDLLEYYNWNI